MRHTFPGWLGWLKDPERICRTLRVFPFLGGEMNPWDIAGIVLSVGSVLGALIVVGLAHSEKPPNPDSGMQDDWCAGCGEITPAWHMDWLDGDRYLCGNCRGEHHNTLRQLLLPPVNLQPLQDALKSLESLTDAWITFTNGL